MAPLPGSPTIAQAGPRRREGRAECALVWRQGLQARWRSLDPAQTDFVRGLMAGLTFADLCAGLTTHLGEAVAAGVAATELRQLIEDGVIHQIQNK